MEEAAEAGFPVGQLTWMPNPVDIAEFRPAEPGEIATLRQRHEIPAHAPVAVYVGRLSPEKGLASLLRGFAQAARAVPEAILLLIGDGAMRSELETLAAEVGLGPEALRFIGRVETSEVPPRLRASDVFALTSAYEGFPCALAEAMSIGLPSVVSRIPGNTQLIDTEVHGLTVRLDDPSAIADALIRLFKDAEARRRMGHAARQRIVEKYATEHVLERYEKLFCEILR